MGPPRLFGYGKLHSRCAFVQLIRHRPFGAGSCGDPVAQKGVGRSFDIVLELRTAILSCLFFGAKIARIVSGKTTKTDPSEVSHFFDGKCDTFRGPFSLPIKEGHPCLRHFSAVVQGSVFS